MKAEETTDIELQKVITQYEIQAVSDMADVIWREHYAAVISAKQIDYMLEKFQSPSAIAQAISEGYRYYFINYAGASVGNISIKLDNAERKMFLSKIYLFSDHRGKGFAYGAVNQLVKMCKENRLNTIWLTVNKKNSSVSRYKRMGFYIADSIVADIGNGFVMDDYLMEMQV